MAGLIAVALALLLPASSVAGAGPVATKSGALINYTTTGKLKLGKSITIPVVCSANCQVTSTVVVKGPGFKLTNTVTGTLQAGVPGGHIIKPNGPLLKSMKANTGRFRLVSSMTATDQATGATDSISHAFRLKR
ncbi:MAG: hypothetical protein ACJ75Z_06620 [Solirubrobacterales bacterium]